MPRDVTHIILAEEVANKVINKKEILENLNAFHMGCVALDSFLYTASPMLSTRLHGGLGDDTRAVVFEMIKRQKTEKNPQKAAEQKAFIYGYVCHMATDIAFHPLIYSISGSQLKKNNHKKGNVALSKSCHRYAETWLDLFLMRKKNLTFENFKPFQKIITDFARRIRLDDFFTDCFQYALKAKKYTWGDNFDLQAQFHNGMTRQLLVDEMTQNKSIAENVHKLDTILQGKLKLYAAGFYDLDADIPQRLTAASFVHPTTGKIINKSINDLEQEAVNNSAAYIRAVDDYIKFGDRKAFDKVIPNINLDTGVENSILSDIKMTITREAYKALSKMKCCNKENSASKETKINLLFSFKKKRENNH